MLIATACALIFFGLLTGFIIAAIHSSNKGGDGAVQTTTTMMTTKTTSTITTQPSPPPPTKTRTATSIITSTSRMSTKTAITRPTTTRSTANKSTNQAVYILEKTRIVHLKLCLKSDTLVKTCKNATEQQWKIYIIGEISLKERKIESRLNSYRLSSYPNGTVTMRPPNDSEQMQKWLLITHKSHPYCKLQNVESSRFLFYHNDKLFTNFDLSQTKLYEANAFWKI